MSIRIVRLGSARQPGEGPRLGTVRRPPRGVPRSEFAKRDYYDLWLPLLSPSADLVKQAQAAADDGAWKAFARSFRREMAAPGPAQLLDTLALLSHGTSFAIGCYCEDERRCHRSILRVLLAERGAALHDN